MTEEKFETGGFAFFAGDRDCPRDVLYADGKTLITKGFDGNHYEVTELPPEGECGYTTFPSNLTDKNGVEAMVGDVFLCSAIQPQFPSTLYKIGRVDQNIATGDMQIVDCNGWRVSFDNFMVRADILRERVKLSEFLSQYALATPPAAELIRKAVALERSHGLDMEA